VDLALSLPFLHLPWVPFTTLVPASVFVTRRIVLGLSMLLVVFDESTARNKRLAVTQTLTRHCECAAIPGNMVQTSLEELQRLTRSKAAWFRLIESGHRVATHAVGVRETSCAMRGLLEILRGPDQDAGSRAATSGDECQCDPGESRMPEGGENSLTGATPGGGQEGVPWGFCCWPHSGALNGLRKSGVLMQPSHTR